MHKTTENINQKRNKQNLPMTHKLTKFLVHKSNRYVPLLARVSSIAPAFELLFISSIIKALSNRVLVGCLPLENENIYVFDLDLDNVIVEWNCN